MRSHARPVLAVAAVVLAALAAACGSAHKTATRRPASPSGVVRSTPSAAQRKASFISVWPACACSRNVVLEQFSLRGGRPLGALTKLPSGQAIEVSNAHLGPNGSVWLTISSGPGCEGPSGSGQCVPAAHSCRSKVVRFDPKTHQTTTVLSFPSSELVRDAVPSPDGRMVAMLASGCANSFLDEHLLVRDLRSGRQWTIGADARRCHTLSEPAWDENGSELVFAYGASTLTPGERGSVAACPPPQLSGLAVVTSARASRSTSWRLVTPDRGCSYESAAFDASGIAAVEGCSQGGRSGSGANTSSGYAYLVQLDHRRRLVEHLRLAHGYDGGAIATDPHTGAVLVSEYQSANQGVPTFDWVWALDRLHVRVIHRYPGANAPSVIAEPW